MSAAGRILSAPALGRRALSLGAAKAFESATQILLPVALARFLDAATFGEYRLLWLAIGTVMALAPLNMPHSLFYFLPRSDPQARALYVRQTLLYLALAGAVGAVALAGPWLPPALRPLAAYGTLVPLLVALHVPAYLLDVLPAVEERIAWQSALVVAMAALRTLLLALAAFLTGELAAMLAILVALTACKLALLLAYCGRRYGLRAPWLQPRVFGGQLAQSAPLGLGGALVSLRGQADQWIVAAGFTLHGFAAFCVAAVLGPLVVLLRQSVNEAFMPSMSRMQAAGDARGMLQLNGRANLMVGMLLYPVLGFAFAFAEELVTVVYTATYTDAAPVMRVYILGLAAMVVELGTVVALLRQGGFALRVNCLSLALSVTISWIGARALGLPGAAAGSVLAIYVDRAFILRRIAALTGIPLRRVQDWRGLALLLGCAAVAAALARMVVDTWLASGAPLARLAAGGLVLAAAFAALKRLALR